LHLHSDTLSELNSKHKDFNFAEGELLLINKPYRWTSFDIVGKVRNAFKPLKLKVGHAGTLDPLATGLLIVCTGKMTKQIDSFQAEEKEYIGTMVLGGTTPSYDMETEVDETFDINHLTEDILRAACAQFTGEIKQFPPAHSAIKVNGERLYEKARRGEEVELKARTVTITEFELTRIELPEVDFKVVCSKGTYIRSLIFDFGKAVNSGAYLSKLRRTRSGNFKVEDAWEVMELVNVIRDLKEPLPNPPREGGLLEEPNEARNYRENANPLPYEILKGNSRSNRHMPTEAENVLWQLLRRDTTGFKIRRQHVIDNYIADFVCLQKGLVIEVDGGYHQHTKEADDDRTEMLNHWGFSVIRITNDEVLRSPQQIFEKIKNEINSLPDRQNSLPPGEGRGGAL
jgi:tRNA pseudouridine55 synthase